MAGSAVDWGGLGRGQWRGVVEVQGQDAMRTSLWPRSSELGSARYNPFAARSSWCMSSTRELGSSFLRCKCNPLAGAFRGHAHELLRDGTLSHTWETIDEDDSCAWHRGQADWLEINE